MPELPEIEVLRRDLEKEVVGRRIRDAEVRPGTAAMKIVKRHGRRKEFSELLAGSKVEKVLRAGVLLVLELDNDHVMVIDLGSTGSLLKTSASDDLAAHTHIVISFTIGGQLRLLDPKKTAQVFVIPRADFEQEAAGRPFSIDPLDAPLTWQHFSAMLEERDTRLRELLRDEAFLVGLGDIYTDEVLFAAGLRFDRPSNKLTSSDVRRLYRALVETLQEAVKARGTSYGENGFKDLSGTPGTFQLELKVFEREGERCRRCRSTIIREEADGGHAYLCPQCQS